MLPFKYLNLPSLILFLEILLLFQGVASHIINNECKALHSHWWKDLNGTLKQVYLNEHVEFYSGTNINVGTKTPFQQISNGWRYAKDTYKPFMDKHTPILHIILHHQNAENCKLSSTIGNDSSCILIQCGPKISSQNVELLDSLIETIASAVQLALTKDTPLRNAPPQLMSPILAYDILNNTGRAIDARRLLENHQETAKESLGRKAYFLRDWLYPIYIKYGGSKVLTNFFTQLRSLFWSHNQVAQIKEVAANTTYFEEMNMGLFVHIWSCAAQVDLSGLAIQSLVWTNTDLLQFRQAQLNYPNYNYSGSAFMPGTKWNHRSGDSKTVIFLSYYNNHVAFYLDPNITATIIPHLKFLTLAWKYAKDTYGPFGPDPLLYVILHPTQNSKDKHCEVPPKYDLVSKVYDNRNIIECKVPFITRDENSNDANSKNNKTSAVSDWINLTQLLLQLGYVIMRNVNELNWPPPDPYELPMKGILAYDILMNITHLKNNTTSNFSIPPPLGLDSWRKDNLKKTDEFPRINTFWFRDWYLPIYENKVYGGTTVLAKFLSARQSYWTYTYDFRVKKMTMGEFVHFWNGVTGDNLWFLAAKTFGWSLQYHRQYFIAQSVYPQFSYSDDYPESSISVPKLKWLEDWKKDKLHMYLDYSKLNDDLSLVYIDAYVAVYFDSQVDTSVTWPFKLLSDGWNYAQRTYNLLGADPILYVFLHEGNIDIECRVVTRYKNNTKTAKQTNESNRNTTNKGHISMDCSRLYSKWKSESDEVLFDLIVALAKAILHIKQREPTHGWNKDSGWDMYQIITFDVLVNIGRGGDAAKFLAKNMINKMTCTPQDCTTAGSFLRHWYYPVYARYGYAQVLSRYLNLLYDYGPDITYVDQDKQFMNIGEFLHFWSVAVGVDLKWKMLELLENDSLRWSLKFELQLINARQKFPNETYADQFATKDLQPLLVKESLRGELLFLGYATRRLAVYFDSNVYHPHSIQWPMASLSSYWRHVWRSYSLLSSKIPANTPNYKVLYIILRGKGYAECQTFWNSIMTMITYRSFIGRYQSYHMIDCGQDQRNAWQNPSSTSMDTLTTQFTHLVQQSGKQTEGHMSYYSPPMSHIIAFDLYVTSGQFENAYRWLKEKILEKEVQSTGEIFWLRDWHLPAYIGWGGVSVLDRLFVLLAGTWPEDGNKIQGQTNNGTMLNMGEIVHFWSTASQTSLLTEAAKVLKWTQRYQREFLEARKQLPNFKYDCYDCGLPHETNYAPMITGVSVFAGLFAITIIVVLYKLYKRKVRSLQQQIRELTSEELNDFFEGRALDNIESENGLVEFSPFNTEFEIPRDQLTVYFDKVLGSGNFGQVLLGGITLEKAYGTDVITVAVKTVKSDVDVTFFKTLLSEVKILGFLGRHKHIASLMGVVTANIKNRELFVALEFCAKGDLLHHMKKCRTNFKDLFNEETAQTDSNNPTASSSRESDNVPLLELQNNSHSSKRHQVESQHILMSTLNLLDWSCQIASGMSFISSKNVIHGDLAARNVLLTSNNVAKISDFGLSRQLANYSVYTRKSKIPLPWRWLAIESLRDMKFSVESDIWSFGVTLYEIFTLGTTPYPGHKWNSEFVKGLEAGLRPELPKYGNKDIFLIMTGCMKQNPSERMTLEDVENKLHEIKRGSCPDSGELICHYSTAEFV